MDNALHNDDPYHYHRYCCCCCYNGDYMGALEGDDIRDDAREALEGDDIRDYVSFRSTRDVRREP